MFNKKTGNAILVTIGCMIKAKSEVKEYKLLSSMDITPFFIDEKIAGTNNELHNLSFEDLFLLYANNLDSLIRVAKHNGEEGLNRLVKLNREFRLKHNKTIFMGLDEFSDVYRQDDNSKNILLLKLTRKDGIFSHVGHEDLVILIRNYNEFIFAAANKNINSVKLKQIAGLIRNKNR